MQSHSPSSNRYHNSLPQSQSYHSEESNEYQSPKKQMANGPMSRIKRLNQRLWRRGGKSHFAAGSGRKTIVYTALGRLGFVMIAMAILYNVLFFVSSQKHWSSRNYSTDLFNMAMESTKGGQSQGQPIDVLPDQPPMNHLDNDEDMSDVLIFDQAAFQNVQATYLGAKSTTEWHHSVHGELSQADNLKEFQVEPMHATVDRRPLTANQQMILDTSNSHNDGQVLGCATSATTFVSRAEEISKSRWKEFPVECNVCIQFSSRIDMNNFLPGIGYQPFDAKNAPTATKCFEGTASLNAKFLNWQVEDERFRDFGYPWTVNCALDNGIQELTCEELSKLNDKANTRMDSVQKVYLKTTFTLHGYFTGQWSKPFNVISEWPWTAVQSHDDDRSSFATKFPKSWDDASSPLIPSSAQELKLVHVEGPLYRKGRHEQSLALESMVQNPNSNGGAHPRLLSNLFHFIRNAPDSVHMMAVVDGQAHRTLSHVQSILNTRISELFPNYGLALLNNIELLKKKEYIALESVPDSSLEEKEATLEDSSQELTLKDVLRLRGIQIQIVPLATPSITFERNVCGGQYAFTSYLAARFAPDYHVMMYIDSDTAMMEQSATLQEILYKRFYSKDSSKCAGHRFRLIEQYVKPEDDTTDRVLQCTKELTSDAKKWEYAMNNCHLKEGHIVARTDSIWEFNVHHPDTNELYVPKGINDCVTAGNIENDRYFLKSDEIVQLHLRDRLRKDECTCFT